MQMNVNEGMHNPGVPFFPVRKFFFQDHSSNFLLFDSHREHK